MRIQVLASVFGPREVDSRADMLQDRAIIKCEYAMAAFSTGESVAHTSSSGRLQQNHGHSRQDEELSRVQWEQLWTA